MFGEVRGAMEQDQNGHVALPEGREGVNGKGYVLDLLGQRN